MASEENPDVRAPLTWVRGYPVYVSTALAGAHTVTMILTALAMAFGAESVLQALVFSSASVLGDFQVWRVATYAFVHQPPYWLFVVELYMLAVFGSEIERWIGRRAFIRLYLILLFAPPFLLASAGLLGLPSVYAGSGALHFGVFIAFAALYPSAEIFFSLQARWVAAGLLAINALQCLAMSDFVSLGVLLADCLVAYAVVKDWRPSDLFARRTEPMPRKDPEPPPIESIDPILEKISRSGMKSLTSRERKMLEKARADLLKKDALKTP